VPLVEKNSEKLTPLTTNLIKQLYAQFKLFDQQVKNYDSQLRKLADQNTVCQEVQKMQGVGPLIASAIKETCTMRDYTSKTVFVGIDVHKKTYSVTCMCEHQIVKRDTLKAKPEHLTKYLNKYFMNAKIKTVYEAGFSGFILHRHLLGEGMDSIVVHAASVEVSARDRVKTDKRDSLKLATQLSSGRLNGIYVPTAQREAYREVTRLRAKVVKDKCRTGHRLKSLLYRQGLIGPDDDAAVSLKWLEKVAQ
jgi:transposase